MLYFDALPEYHFGSIRQQIWAFLRFPFHLVLVLFMEAMAQFVIWFKMNEAAKYASSPTPHTTGTNTPSTLITFLNSPGIQNDETSSNSTALVSAINSTVLQLLDTYQPVDYSIYDTLNNSLITLQAGYQPDNDTSVEDFSDTFLDLAYAVIHSVYQTYEFDAPESESAPGTPPPTGADELANDYNVITLVFIYFFVSVGVTLILMGLLNFLTLPRSSFRKAGLKHPGVWGRIGVFFVVGSAMAGLAGLINLDAGYNLSISPWLLPIVALGLVIVLGVQNVRWPQKTETVEEE
jgi:hypothetical protein